MACQITEQTKDLNIVFGDKYYIKYKIGPRDGTFELCTYFIMQIEKDGEYLEILGERLDPGTSTISFFVDSEAIGSGEYLYSIIGKGNVNGLDSKYTFAKNLLMRIE